MELMTVSEVAALLQVSRQQVQTWYIRRGTNGFPEPVLLSERGKLWAEASVVQWRRTYRPTHGGRPRKS